MNEGGKESQAAAKHMIDRETDTEGESRHAENMWSCLSCVIYVICFLNISPCMVMLKVLGFLFEEYQI